jgi:hypothetical protein
VGGSSRGADVAATTLTALVPNHTGLTIASQPVLYWYLSRPSTHPIEITVVPEAGTSPLFESRLNPPIAAGVHEFRLADLGVQLSPNSVYHWYVAMVRNADRRSQDVITGGVLERVTSPEGLAAALALAPLADHPRLYADAGLWYDALDALSHLIKTAPTDLTWRAQRAALLDQAMLTEAAMYDREAMPRPANP